MSDRSEMPADVWVVEESGFDRERANFYETLFTVGNGRLGTRGSLEEGHLGQLSGTFLAGVYDGHDVPVIDLVNAPDWVDTAVVVDGVRLDVDTCTVVAHHRALDLRDGLLTRTTVFEDAEGRRTRLDTVRCASMADRRICALRVEVTPENHAAEIGWRPGSTATAATSNGCRCTRRGRCSPRRSAGRSGPAPSTCGRRPDHAEPDALYLEMRTIDTGVDIGFAAATASRAAPAQRKRCASATSGSPRRPCTAASRARPCGWTSSSRSAHRVTRPRTAPEPFGTGAARCWASTAGAGSIGVVAASRAVWGRLWDACDCEVVGDTRYTRALRFCIYHLLIAANPDDPTVNIGAKRWRGSATGATCSGTPRSSCCPFYILTQPDTAKALLRYRHHTLDGARANSREYGTSGARYAWESADTGREECPQFTADGANRFWTREEEIHVSADVAYGIVRYVEATGDTAFLHDVGAEILFETSRFWVDRAVPRRRGVRAPPGHGARRVPLPHRQQHLHQPPRPVAPGPGRDPAR